MIIQNISTKLNDNTRRYNSRSILLYFIFLIITLFQPLNAQTLNFPNDDGRHEDADFEAWSLFTHLETEKGLQFGVSIFFFTGKVIGIKASGLYVVIADIQKKEYQNFSKIQVPLFSSTTHTVGRLMENYSDNVLERDTISGLYKVNIEMDEFSISLKYDPLKEAIDIGQLAVGDESFNRAYAIPRGKISAQILYEGGEYQLDGIGIFQHQWGDKPEQSALSDIFALHLKDSTDILIYHSETFPKINTMIISDGNGENRILRNFTAKADTIISVESSNDKFKLEWKFKPQKNQFEIKISPSFKGQEIEMLGLSYWLSRCKVV
ncbi:hypothetical protein MNBD_IGNAVI01-2654, partial [hydrothermal vent metagenome]